MFQTCPDQRQRREFDGRTQTMPIHPPLTPATSVKPQSPNAAIIEATSWASANASMSATDGRSI